MLSATPPQNPGIYPGPGQAGLLRANEQAYLFQQNLITAGLSAAANGSNASASIAVQLERIKSSYYPFGMSFQIFFTNSSSVFVTPGSFEIDVQTADLDQDWAYVTIQSLTGGLNSNFNGRIELPLFWAKFTRLYVKTLTAGVYTNGLVTR